MGFHPTFEPSAEQPELQLPPEFGLSPPQMRLLGLTNPDIGSTVEPDTLSAKSWYAGPDAVCEANRQPVAMAGRRAIHRGKIGGAGRGKRSRRNKPPDLPSLLLDSRICYIGMPLVPSVTELIVTELLWLNYDARDKPIYIYVNSIGSQTGLGEVLALETEATAILDTMAYIRPDIYTLVIGEARGNAALILASGKKGCRYAMPNARVQTCPPRINRTWGPTKDLMIRANELEANTQVFVDFMSAATGKDTRTIRKDMGRNKWYTPQSAIDYGLLDHVVQKRQSTRLGGEGKTARLAPARPAIKPPEAQPPRLPQPPGRADGEEPETGV